MGKINWLASYPKSGNTWVRMFLNCYRSGYLVDINAPYQYVMSDIDQRIYQLLSSINIAELPQNHQFAIRPAALVNMLYCYSHEGICLKTHFAKIATADVPVIPELITNKAIYIIRDPRDIVISYAKHLGKTVDFTIDKMNDPSAATTHENGLVTILMSWSLHVKSWTELNRNVETTVVLYENLVKNPKQEFKRILKGLDLAYNERLFEFALNQTKFKNLQRLEQANKFKELGSQKRFFDKGRAGYWKQELKDSQIDRIEKDHGDILNKYYRELSYA